MSERILTLFGEELVPEPPKAAGKGRGKKKQAKTEDAGSEAKADEAQPEVLNVADIVESVLPVVADTEMHAAQEREVVVAETVVAVTAEVEEPIIPKTEVPAIVNEVIESAPTVVANVEMQQAQKIEVVATESDIAVIVDVEEPIMPEAEVAAIVNDIVESLPVVVADVEMPIMHETDVVTAEANIIPSIFSVTQQPLEQTIENTQPELVVDKPANDIKPSVEVVGEPAMIDEAGVLAPIIHESFIPDYFTLAAEVIEEPLQQTVEKLQPEVTAAEVVVLPSVVTVEPELGIIEATTQVAEVAPIITEESTIVATTEESEPQTAEAFDIIVDKVALVTEVVSTAVAAIVVEPAKKARTKRTKAAVEVEEDAAGEKRESVNLPADWQGSKHYYSIGEVADLFKVKTSHIRFWTNEFKLKVRTTRKGDRLYTPDQIKELRAIHHLVKERKFTLSGAKTKLKQQNKRDVETIDLKQSLQQLKTKLVTMRDQL